MLDTVYSKQVKKEVQLDGRYAKVILLACLCQSVFIGPASSAFGLQFSSAVGILQLTTVEVCIIFNVYFTFFNLMLFFAGPLCEEFGPRIVCLVASLITSASYISMIGANSLLYMVMMYGVLFGCSSGMCFQASLAIIPHFFDKRRGFALSINAMASGVGKLSCPIIAAFLIENFGVSGSILLHGGIFLNGCVFSSLYRKFPEKVNGGSKVKEKGVSLLKSVGRKFKMSITALRSYRVLVIGIGLSIYFTGFANSTMFSTYHLLSEGYSHRTVAFTLSSCAISSTVTRMIISFVVDCKKFNSRIVYIGGSFLSGAAAFAFAFSPSYITVVSSLVIYGLGTGIFMSLWPVVLLDAVHLDAYIQSVSACGLLTSILYVFVGPLLGVIGFFDISYRWSLVACGCLQIFNGVLQFLLPLATRLDEEKGTQKKKTSDKVELELYKETKEETGRKNDRKFTKHVDRVSVPSIYTIEKCTHL